jgi:ribosomal protein L11 methyltransferase
MLAWLELAVTLPMDGAETAYGLLDQIGCVGVAQKQTANGSVTVIGYLPSTEDATEKLGWLMERLEWAHQQGWLSAPASVTTRLLDAEEWEVPLKESLPPLPIGNRFLVLLTDDPAPPTDRIVLRLQSLGGFGTGHHPTTRLCLELLENCEVTGKRVLDVGTGSGILAIAAARLGAAEVVATDIDDAALEAAQENAKRNGVAERIRFVKSDLLRKVAGKFDLVLANLLTPFIKDLAWQLRSKGALSEGGIWIGSGVSTEGWDEVKPLLSKLGYRLRHERILDGWVAFEAFVGTPDRRD